MTRKLETQCLGQADDAGLGGGIIRLPDIAAIGHGGDVDNAATGGLHMRHHRARAVERAFEHQIDDEVPIGVGNLLDQVVADLSGIVDQDIDPSERLDGRIDHVGDLDRRGHVGGMDQNLEFSCREIVGDRLRRLGILVVDDDRRAGFGEAARQRAADAATRAGDDRNLAVKSFQVPPRTDATYRRLFLSA